MAWPEPTREGQTRHDPAGERQNRQIGEGTDQTAGCIQADRIAIAVRPPCGSIIFAQGSDTLAWS